MAKLMPKLIPVGRHSQMSSVGKPDRIGTFVCECGGQISDTVDTTGLGDHLRGLPGVVHSQVLPSSCSQEAAETIAGVVESQNLDAVVLAACACCTEDQACYSCSFQRFRSRQNLGLIPGSDGRIQILEGVRFELVNIREQCAWAHGDDPGQATAMALALTTGAISRLSREALFPARLETIPPSILILGSGAGATVSRRLLKARDVHVERVRGYPDSVERTGGHYLAVRGKDSWGGTALILAPKDTAERQRLLAAFGESALKPRQRWEWGVQAAHRPGIYFCDPKKDPKLSGAAAVARSLAWIGRAIRGMPGAARVDAFRCRACGSCQDLCEFGAPELTGIEPDLAAQIDPLICLACGTCAAHCPSGAIQLPGAHQTDLDMAFKGLEALGI
jgi:heterodisulfide reductase subunit A-like polyferredoxin